MHFLNAVTLLALPLVTFAAPHKAMKASKGYQVGTFYVNWAIYARQYFVTDLPADKLTKVTYAFANINSTTGEMFLSDEWADLQYRYPSDVAVNGTQLYGNFKQLYKLKEQNRYLQTYLSVGGWTYRPNFRPGLSTPSNRKRFAESAVKLIADLGLDGLDIDWEYPEGPTDAANLIDTVRLCREYLDSYSLQYANGYHFGLSISSPAGPIRYQDLPIKEMDTYVDYWNLMAFDYQGPGFSNYTGHNSNVYPSKKAPKTTDFNTEQAVDYYKPRIASPSKLILGLPLYGRSFANTAGLGQKFNGSGDGTWEPGVLDYKVLPLNGSTIYTDKDLIASWSYDKKTRQFVTFDTPEVQVLKTQYLRKEKLGGAWWWESSGDRTDDQSLVSTVSEALGDAEGIARDLNNLYYPISKYDNIRKPN